jgi:hypothetical protein
MGADARRLSAPQALYRGLRSVALRLLLVLAAGVHWLSGGRAPLTVISTVTDRRYQQQLGVSDPEATTGYTFQIARRYVNEAQAAAFQALLDRLQSLDVIAWLREPDTIDVTVASDATRVLAVGP